MIDQAERLRQVVKGLKAVGAKEPVNGIRIITITSGKGGVGKTTLTINLAIALQELGNRVLIIDADFGLSNIDLMLGILPKYNLSHVISNQKKIPDIITKGPKGILFISGGSGVLDLLRLSAAQLECFMNQIQQLDSIADIILIDTGAGISGNVIKMVLSAQETILVTTSEPTAITDAYALVKTTLEMDRNIVFRLVINKAQDKNEALETLDKFNSVTERFLNFTLDKLGHISYDTIVFKSAKMQEPFILYHANHGISKQIRSIAQSIMNPSRTDSSEIKSMTKYITQLVHLFKMKGSHL